ncbi:hypothetical protein LINPERPRIM_LOCUS21701, partial [Linum perenne]
MTVKEIGNKFFSVFREVWKLPRLPLSVGFE